MADEPRTRLERYTAARTAVGDRTVLEGLHAVKHALRFGAELTDVVSTDLGAILDLARAVAPDVVDELQTRADPIDPAAFAELAPRPPATPLLALGPVVRARAAAVLATCSGGARPVVVLDDPRHHGNTGAVIRVAAAAGAEGVLTTGGLDPWGPTVVRTAAGLHHALAVGRVADAGPALVTERPVVALDPDGSHRRVGDLPLHSVLVFGSERRGLSAAARARADVTVGLPMRPGVSSLNLATSVAATLYLLAAR